MANLGKCHNSGYCCTVAPCPYGQMNKQGTACKFLSAANEIGQRFCEKYEEIVDAEKDNPLPMMGSGCSSTLFNEVRNEIITRKKKLQKESQVEVRR